MNKHKTFLFSLLCLLTAGSTALSAADNPDFSLTGEAEDFTYLTCEYYNSGCWTSGDCRIVVCDGEYLKLSTLPNHYVPTWTGPNGFSYTGQNVNLGNVSPDQAGEYHASYRTSSGYTLRTTITVDVLTEPTLTIEETHETCHGRDGALDLTVSDLPSGVFFEYYNGNYSYLPEHFNTNHRDQSGISSTGFDVSLADYPTTFAMRFSATITLPTTGMYTFYTASDDGSKLYIDGNRIVNNDGYHTLRERSGNVYLEAGQHQIVVSYFRGNTGAPLQVKYKGPGISKRHIPTSILSIPYAIHWSNGACTEDLTNLDDGNYSVWVKYGGYNCTADAHATINPGWDYLTDPGYITSENIVECVETSQGTYDPPAFETTAATCRGGRLPSYQWQEKTSMSGHWTSIPGATDKDYDPEPRGEGSSWYRRLAKCSCSNSYPNNASTNVRDIHIIAPPEAVSTAVYKDCDANTGNILFTFKNTSRRIKVSIDGGASFTTVPSDDKAFTFRHLAPGTYSTVIKWKNTDCEKVIGDVVIDPVSTPSLSITATDSDCDDANGALDLTISGLDSKLFYEAYHVSTHSLPNFNHLHSCREGYTEGFNIAVAERCDLFAVRYTGNIEIATTGDYTFFTTSDDGSKLLIDGQVVVNNDGLHAARERSGTVQLTAGTHRIEVQVFEKYGHEVLEVRYSGPGIAKQEIPTSVLSVPYSIEWSNGATTEDLTNLSAGDYDVTVTYGGRPGSGDICTVTTTGTVEGKNLPTASINASITAICSEESVVFTAGPSASGSKYNWDFGEYSIDRYRLGAGPHEVTFVLPDDLNGNDWTKAMLTVTNQGCEDVALKTIDIRDLPEITAVESTDPACEDNNGTITVFFVDNPNRSHISFSLNGAAGPFTTLRDTEGSLTFDELGEGDYDLFVKWGNHQCGTELDDVTLTAQPGPEVIASGGELVCAGESVTLTASASGGTAPLTITWMPGGETGESITVSPDETTVYTATVTDANACTASDDATVETFTDNLTDAGQITTGNFSECVEEGQTADPPSFDATPATCSDGSPAVYQWQEKTSMSGVWADIPGATDEDYDPEPREISSSWYRRQAKCDCDSDFTSSNVRDVHVRELPEVTVESTDPACEGNNGIITVFFVDNPTRTHISFSLNGAAGPFTTVPDSDGSLVFDELSEGSYDLFVKWGNGQCGTDLDDVILTDQPGPEVTAPDAALICEDESVTLTATASGGTAPLSVLWMPGGETSASITVSPDMTTTYTVKVTDANGCMDTDEVIVTVNDNPAFEVTKVDATCDEDNGSATATGDASLSYTWSNGETTATITGLAPGTYSVTATSPEGCTDAKSVLIEGSPGVNVSVDAVEICVGETATLIASLSGGTAPYTISWSPGGEDTESIIVSPDMTSTYSVTVTDANGCTASANGIVTVNDAPDFTVTSTDATCDEDNGTATATGDAGLSYLWSNGATTATITGLAAGTYSVTATSPEGCTETETVLIDASPGSEVDIVCDNTETVTRMTSMVPDCRGPFMVGYWTGNMLQDVTSSARFDVINGKFVENPTDGTATFTASLVSQSDINIVFDIVTYFTGRTTVASNGSPKENILCIGDLDNSDWYYYSDFSGTMTGAGDMAGAIVDIIPFGEPFQLGTGANLFDENGFGASGWNELLIVSQPDDPTKVLRNNAKGDYNFYLTDPAPVVADCYSICAGESSVLTASASGTPEFSYVWSTGETTATITVSPAVTTEYSVTITDENGCEATDVVEIVVNEVPTFSVMATDASCGDANGSASITGASSGDLSYQWSTGESGMSVSGLAEGVYSVTATSPAGCTAVEVFIISSTPDVRARIQCANPEVVTRDVSLVQECDRPLMAGFWASNLMRDISGSARFDIIDGKFVENPADGTAVFTARLENQGLSVASFDVTVNFTGRTSTPPAGSPKENVECIGDVDNSDWYYYPSFSGQMIGSGILTGAVVDIVPFGESFQVGTGANLYDENAFGAGGWLQFFVVSQPTDLIQVLVDRGRGDINVNLTGDAGTPPVANDCFDIIAGQSSVLEAYASSGTPAFTYEWNTGETTPTITVTPTETTFYRVTITDANGCTDDELIFIYVTDPGSARTAVTTAENGTEGASAGNLTASETATTPEAEEARLSAPTPSAPATVWSNEEYVFDLAQNAPNPFSNETVVRFTLPKAGSATLTVVDLAGRTVREIRQDFAAGQNVVQLDGEGLTAGTYVYTLMFNGERLTRRMIHMPR